MKKNPFILLVIILIGFSCKKKENTPEPASTTTGSTTTSGPASFSALYSTQLLHSIFGTNATTLTTCFNTAFASASDFTNFNYPLGPFLDIGTLSNNGTTYKNLMGFYMDTTYTFAPGPYIWQVTGNAIPSFTFTNNNLYATYSDYTMWTDTIRKSAGLSIPLTGITDATEARIYLSVTGATTTAQTATVVLSTASNYSFSPSSLSSLSTATTAGIQIDLYRNSIQTINGKKMNFRSTTSFVKTVPVKN